MKLYKKYKYIPPAAALGLIIILFFYYPPQPLDLSNQIGETTTIPPSDGGAGLFAVQDGGTKSVWGIPTISSIKITDSDGDGVPDNQDNCPLLSNPDQTDTDRDWVGDACDNCRNFPNPFQEDFNGNGEGDACETQSGQTTAPPQVQPTVGDSDGDGIPDSIDLCPDKAENFNSYQDTDGCPDTPPAEQPSQPGGELPLLG